MLRWKWWIKKLCMYKYYLRKAFFVIQNKDTHLTIWFTFQKTKYVWDEGERKEFVALSYPIEKPFKEYMEWKGYGTEDQLQQAQQIYGTNR